MSEEVKRGKVKVFSSQRGYGFIAAPDNEEVIFFHHSDVQGNKYLKQNDQVEFEIGEGVKGPRAVKVRRVEEREEVEEETAC